MRVYVPNTPDLVKRIAWIKGQIDELQKQFNKVDSQIRNSDSNVEVGTARFETWLGRKTKQRDHFASELKQYRKALGDLETEFESKSEEKVRSGFDPFYEAAKTILDEQTLTRIEQLAAHDATEEQEDELQQDY